MSKVIRCCFSNQIKTLNIVLLEHLKLNDLDCFSSFDCKLEIQAFLKTHVTIFHLRPFVILPALDPVGQSPHTPHSQPEHACF